MPYTAADHLSLIATGICDVVQGRIALLRQALVECLFLATVLFMYKPSASTGTPPNNVHHGFLIRYGTSPLVFV